MAVSHANILKALAARLTGDATLSALVGGRIYNHLPQDAPLPAIRFRWEQGQEWDCKDSEGWDGRLTVDVWTDQRGDLQPLAIVDRVNVLLHNAPLTLPAPAQSVVLRHFSFDRFTEPDGITHHSVIRFLHLASD